MRRFALTLLASLSVAVLSACSGYGGSGLGGGDSNSYSALVFSTGAQGPDGIFKLAPSSTVPLVVTVFGTKSSLAITQFNTTATWQVTYAPAPAVFQSFNGTNTQPQQVNCPAAPSPQPGWVNPSNAFVVEAPGATNWIPYTPGTFYQTIGIMPPAPAGGLSTPAPAAAPVTVGPGFANTNLGYCLNVVATASNGTVGSFIMYVGN